MEGNTDSVILKRFGRYLLLDHLIDGGMATICRARFLHEEGNKIVAIKMIRPQFSENEAFTQMFLDEVKVAFGLVHPNIAQLLDAGKQANQLFSVLEYVEGRNLKEMLDRTKRDRTFFPVDVAIFILSQVCQGLYYAHNFVDRLTGKNATIIHRDMSPHNVMVGYDGAVKIIDFGIAKAATNRDATQAGILKGKVAYLAPEYLAGLPLDHRYDQFCVGITLWESLTNRKLFNAENEIDILKQIQTCKIPIPSSINPSVSSELDKIVLKALSKNRDERYSDMDQMNRALVKFLYGTYPNFNPTDLVKVAKNLFAEEITKDHERLMEFGKVDLKPFQEEERIAVVKPPVQTIQLIKKVTEFDLGIKETQISKKNTAIKRLPTVESKGIYRAEGNIQIHAGMIKKTKPLYSRVRHTGEDTGISVGERGSSFKFLVLLAIILSVAGYFIFPGYIVKMGKLAGVFQKPEIEEPPITEPSRPGMLTLIGADPYMEFVLDGKVIKYQGLGIPLTFDEEHKIVIKKRGYQNFEYSFTLDRNNQIKNLPIPTLAVAEFGEVFSSKDYESGTKLVIKVGDTTENHSLPLKTNLRVPAGTYEAEIVNDALGTSKSIEFEVVPNKVIQLPK
jgi:serine/threonine-protein kinase